MIRRCKKIGSLNDSLKAVHWVQTNRTGLTISTRKLNTNPLAPIDGISPLGSANDYKAAHLLSATFGCNRMTETDIQTLRTNLSFRGIDLKEAEVLPHQDQISTSFVTGQLHHSVDDVADQALPPAFVRELIRHLNPVV